MAKRVCPCCGKWCSERTVYRHLRNYEKNFELPSSDSDLADDDTNSGSEPVDGGKFLGDVEMEPGLGQNEEPAHVPGNMDIDAPTNMGPNRVYVPFLGQLYRILRNPPVAINDWDDPADSDSSEADDDSTDQESVGSDQDPVYNERTVAPEPEPDDEPAIDHDVLRAFLEEHLIDLDDDEWEELQARELSRKDMKMLELLATRLRTHFSRQTWNDLRLGVCAEHEIPSEFIAWRRLRILAGLDTRAYDCCLNSCCCFLGKYAALDRCPFCREKRYNSRGQARRVFHYTPLIPQLSALFKNSAMATKLRYRATADQDAEPGVIHDVFDGENYHTLRETPLDPAGGYHFFDNPEDVALGLSTDGVSLFKRRRRGLSTAWPIILINYNLHPRYRTKLENILCVGVIPGPYQCKDINSFLVPLLEELLELEAGVDCSGLSPDGISYAFVLRAFLIIVFGDIPAVSKMIAMKGHNGVTPCRACYMQGTPCKLGRSTIYYIPLRRPTWPRPFPCDQLPMRSHKSFLDDIAKIEAARTITAREDLMKDLGINSRSIFTHLKSIDLSSSFPYDIMHLLFENLIPNMIKHWTGGFKWLDQGNGTYEIPPATWKTLGRLTAEATRTIPSAFVGTLPNIAEDPKLFKAEAHAFWFQYMAPSLLKGVLTRRYYDHFIKAREIIIRVTKFCITDTEIGELQTMINDWVNGYELLYYQYAAERLPACRLTIHALLHMPYYIRRTGPLWASWAFVMERFCGYLLPAVKNRTRPYEMIDNYVSRDAQMKIVTRAFNLPLIGRPRVQTRVMYGVEVSSRETMHEEFDKVVLGTPVKKRNVKTPQLENQLIVYFSLVSQGRTRQQIKNRINFDSLISYGRLRMVPDGDRIRTAGLIEGNSGARDNSFVKYDLLPDRNAAYRNRADIPYRRTYYGRLMGIYYVRFIEDDGICKPYLLASVRECNTDGVDAAMPESPVVTYDTLASANIVHIDTIIAVVGRIKMGETWAIVDRSRDNVRPRFNDDANDGGDDDYN